MMQIYHTELTEITPQIKDRLRGSFIILIDKRVMQISECGKFQNGLSKEQYKKLLKFFGRKETNHLTIRPLENLTDMQQRAAGFYGVPAEYLKESDMEFYRSYHRGFFYGSEIQSSISK